MPAFVCSESFLQEQTLANAALGHLNHGLGRIDAQAAADEDQVFEFHLRFGIAGTEGLVRFAEALYKVERYSLRQRGRVGRDRDVMNGAKCYQCASLRLRLGCLEKGTERPARGPARTVLIGNTQAAANSPQPTHCEVGQSYDNIRANTMQYQTAREFRAPILPKQHILLRLRTQVSPHFVRNAPTHLPVVHRQSSSCPRTWIVRWREINVYAGDRRRRSGGPVGKCWQRHAALMRVA
jgi:hypothetical protein